MRITLPNGITLEGTSEQLKEFIPTLKLTGIAGDEEIYFSEHLGPVRITQMHTCHLMNAILKFYRGWVQSCSSINDPQELIRVIEAGISDRCWTAMCTECARREIPIREI